MNQAIMSGIFLKEVYFAFSLGAFFQLYLYMCNLLLTVMREKVWSINKRLKIFASRLKEICNEWKKKFYSEELPTPNCYDTGS